MWTERPSRTSVIRSKIKYGPGLTTHSVVNLLFLMYFKFTRIHVLGKSNP